MAELGNSLRRGDTPTDRGGGRAVIERIQTLTWALLDEQITDDEVSLLEKLLLSDGQARKCHIECVQLHCLTANYFTSVNQTPKGTTTSPVLESSEWECGVELFLNTLLDAGCAGEGLNPV
jgi:hypothetical protein